MTDEKQTDVAGYIVEYSEPLPDEDYEDEEECPSDEDYDGYDDEIEAAISAAIVERSTAMDMMQGMIEHINGTYGLLKDSEMNVIYSTMAKARNRIEDSCRSEEFVCQEILPLLEEDESYGQEEEG